MMKTRITQTVDGLLRAAVVLAILASWREAIWLRVRSYKSGKLFIVRPSFAKASEYRFVSWQ